MKYVCGWPYRPPLASVQRKVGQLIFVDERLFATNGLFRAAALALERGQGRYRLLFGFFRNKIWPQWGWTDHGDVADEDAPNYAKEHNVNSYRDSITGITYPHGASNHSSRDWLSYLGFCGLTTFTRTWKTPSRSEVTNMMWNLTFHDAVERTIQMLVLTAMWWGEFHQVANPEAQATRHRYQCQRPPTHYTWQVDW